MKKKKALTESKTTSTSHSPTKTSRPSEKKKKALTESKTNKYLTLSYKNFAAKRKKKALTESKTNKYLTLSYKNFAAKRKKKSSNRIKDKQVPHTLLQKLRGQAKKKKL